MMLRKVLASLLGADPTPAVIWSEIETLEVLARTESRVTRLWSGFDTVQQVSQGSKASNDGKSN